MPLTQDLGRFASGLTLRKPAARGGRDRPHRLYRHDRDDDRRRQRPGAAASAPRPRAGARDRPACISPGESAAAPEAAWINGTAGHALDYDDVGCRGHLSTVLVPAILAEAETLGLGGREMFAAYVAGYETWAELARRDPGHHHVKGWHPTGIFGAIGAGAACAALRRLDREPGDDGDRAVGLAGRRHHGQFRHDDKAVPRRPRGACRAGLGPPRRTRLYGGGRCARTPAGLPVGGVARGARRPREPDPARRGMADRQAGSQHQEIPGLLLHPPGARRDARPAREAAAEAGRDQHASPCRSARRTR